MLTQQQILDDIDEKASGFSHVDKIVDFISNAKFGNDTLFFWWSTWATETDFCLQIGNSQELIVARFKDDEVELINKDGTEDYSCAADHSQCYTYDNAKAYFDMAMCWLVECHLRG